MSCTCSTMHTISTKNLNNKINWQNLKKHWCGLVPWSAFIRVVFYCLSLPPLPRSLLISRFFLPFFVQIRRKGSCSVLNIHHLFSVHPPHTVNSTCLRVSLIVHPLSSLFVNFLIPPQYKAFGMQTSETKIVLLCKSGLNNSGVSALHKYCFCLWIMRHVPDEREKKMPGMPSTMLHSTY